MHTPRHFRADLPEREGRLVRENPFGLIVSAAGVGSAGGVPGDGVPADGLPVDGVPVARVPVDGLPVDGVPVARVPGAPVATHVPMLRRPGPDGPPADGEPLLGGTIIGHLARTNPQGEALRTAGRALAVFLGPEGYVSPTLYDPSKPQAPTWNYAAVHLSGPVRVVDDRDEALAIMRATIDATESYAGTGWDPTSSLGYIDKLLAGVAAFEITVEDVRSTFKLSQNKPADTQRRVHASFAASEHGRDRELAALMADVLGLAPAGVEQAEPAG